MRSQNVGKFRAAFQRRGILFICEKLNALLLEERRLRWKASSRFVLARQFFGFDLASFNVRLVEGVDPDDRTGDGCGDFPTEKFLPEVVSIWQRDAHHRMPGFFERSDRGILRLVGLRCQTQISEDTIVAVGSWLGEAFAINRNNALAYFSGGFVNQLFEPRSKIEDSRLSYDGEFFPAMIRCSATYAS